MFLTHTGARTLGANVSYVWLLWANELERLVEKLNHVMLSKDAQTWTLVHLYSDKWESGTDQQPSFVQRREKQKQTNHQNDTPAFGLRRKNKEETVSPCVCCCVSVTLNHKDNIVGLDGRHPLVYGKTTNHYHRPVSWYYHMIQGSPSRLMHACTKTHTRAHTHTQLTTVEPGDMTKNEILKIKLIYLYIYLLIFILF